jgi:nicotinamidase-related amidase
LTRTPDRAAQPRGEVGSDVRVGGTSSLRKEPPVPVDPKRTAVVLIEYQNDFTSEGGALHGAVQDVMEKTGMPENTRELVETARAAGATIIHAPISFAPGYGELSEHPHGILKGVVDSSAFVKAIGEPRSSMRWRRRRAT